MTSDLQVFEDPSIQNNPKHSFKKSSLALGKQGSSERVRVPSDLPSGQSKSPYELKKWKSTREPQLF
jgi:hypothetical protein